MTIAIRNTQRTVRLSVPVVRAQLRDLLAVLGCPDWDLGVWLASNRAIHDLNRTYRGVDAPTDVLSFQFHDASGVLIRVPGKLPAVKREDDRNLGELVLGMPYVRAYCVKEGLSVQQHLPTLFTHGLCHLLGYTHDSDTDHERMSRCEQAVLNEFHAMQAAKRQE
eukprot:jgi/Chlat1/856/Chrsp104S01292